MKVCGVCNRTYPDSRTVCEHDGHRLQHVRRSDPTANAPTLDWDGPMPGDLVGVYRIEGLIAEGGMGRLYKATHVELDHAVALKFLLPEHVARADLVRRFFNEARAVNAIRHPNIIEIHDFVEEIDREGCAQVYIVMEYLYGEDARRRMVRDGPYPPLLLTSVAVQVAEALAAAHDAGILHRDLKPDNIFLCNSGPRDDFVKLLDFGAAKGFGPRPGDHLTRPGVAIGTPEYMSPEQINNSPLDGRVDAYGLGCVCYELLTGRLPFTGDNAAQILAKHVREPPTPISEVRDFMPPVPSELEAVVLRCMAKLPEDRYPDLWAVAEAFRGCVHSPAVEAVSSWPELLPPTRRPRAEPAPDGEDWEPTEPGPPDLAELAAPALDHPDWRADQQPELADDVDTEEALLDHPLVESATGEVGWDPKPALPLRSRSAALLWVALALVAGLAIVLLLVW